MHRITPSRRDLLAAFGLAAFTSAPSRATDPPGDKPVALPDTPRELKPTGADLGSVYPEVEKIAADNEYRLAYHPDRFRSFDDFHSAAREKLLDLLQYRPAKVDPKPEVLERVDRGDHVREKVLFNTSPHFRVPAYVLIPKKAKLPAPGIVDLHSHGGMFLFGKEKVIDLGKNHPTMTDYHRHNYDGRPTSTALVRRGYVVISIDALMFGERRVLMDRDQKYGWDRSRYSAEDVAHLNAVCRGKENTLAKALTFAGATWPGIVAWDDVRTVDYLVTRPEVDPKRIGCLGISMGGYRSIYLPALDERVKAACIVGFLSTVRPMIRAHIDTHSWVHFLPGLHRHLDLPDVVTLAAPRAVLVQQCSRDGLFPLAGMKAGVARIAEVYKQAGAEERFAGRFYDVPHKFTRAMQEEAFRWLDRHLGR
jgi:dienelactone hydrolase